LPDGELKRCAHEIDLYLLEGQEIASEVSAKACGTGTFSNLGAFNQVSAESASEVHGCTVPSVGKCDRAYASVSKCDSNRPDR
jgi:hypothetical protein